MSKQKKRKSTFFFSRRERGTHNKNAEPACSFSIFFYFLEGGSRFRSRSSHCVKKRNCLTSKKSQLHYIRTLGINAKRPQRHALESARVRVNVIGESLQHPPPRSESIDPSIFRILLENVRCKRYTKFQRSGTTPVVDHEHGRNVSLNPRRRHQSPEILVRALPETGSGHRYTTKNKEANNNVCAYRRRDRASRLPYKFRQGAILASWFPWLAGPVRSPPPLVV